MLGIVFGYILQSTREPDPQIGVLGLCLGTSYGIPVAGLVLVTCADEVLQAIPYVLN